MAKKSAREPNNLIGIRLQRIPTSYCPPNRDWTNVVSIPSSLHVHSMGRNVLVVFKTMMFVPWKYPVIFVHLFYVFVFLLTSFLYIFSTVPRIGRRRTCLGLFSMRITAFLLRTSPRRSSVCRHIRHCQLKKKNCCLCWPRRRIDFIQHINCYWLDIHVFLPLWNEQVFVI